jgi:acylglycerol lipase
MSRLTEEDSNHEILFLTTQDQVDLFVQVDTPKTAAVTATILIIHGVCEHSGRYDRLTSHLNRNGYQVIRFDLRGHGKSNGVKGYVKSFKQFSEDANTVVDWIKKSFSDLPIYMIGHSMGAFIGVDYALRYPGKLKAQVLSGLPAIILPLPDIKLLKMLPYNLFPMIYVRNRLSKRISKDLAVVKDYETDPLNLMKSTIKMSGEMFIKGPKHLAGRIHEYQLPCLILHGEEDKIVVPESSEWFFRNISSTDKKRILYPTLYHEIFNEPEYEVVIKNTIDWLNAHQTDL